MKCVIGILIAAFLVSFQTTERTQNVLGRNSWVGSYVNEYGTVLTVKEQTPVDITFEIVNRKGECQESFRGKATLTTATNATYQDRNNVLIITLLKRTDGKIELSETGFEHSPDCLSFSGIFNPSY
jgi:hypothetical protein